MSSIRRRSSGQHEAKRRRSKTAQMIGGDGGCRCCAATVGRWLLLVLALMGCCRTKSALVDAFQQRWQHHGQSPSSVASPRPRSRDGRTHGNGDNLIRLDYQVGRRSGGGRARTLVIDEEDEGDSTRSFDPFNLASQYHPEVALESPGRFLGRRRSRTYGEGTCSSAATATGLISAGAFTSSLFPQFAAAAESAISTGQLDPSTFTPVCPASDGFYRFLQSGTVAVVGKESFVEYGPLIAGGLLRVRLELCVVESFFNEAVLPFVKDKGLGWILPLHETVETFLAGVIFALATTFILIGSTKILTVIITYTDFLIGLPCRTLGGFAFDRARGKPVTFDIGFGPLKKRVVGPGDPKDEDGTGPAVPDIDYGDMGVAQLFFVVLSGGARLIGTAIGVCVCVRPPLFSFVPRILSNSFFYIHGIIVSLILSGRPRITGRARLLCREVPVPVGVALHRVQVRAFQSLPRLPVISRVRWRVRVDKQFGHLSPTSHSYQYQNKISATREKCLPLKNRVARH